MNACKSMGGCSTGDNGCARQELVQGPRRLRRPDQAWKRSGLRAPSAGQRADRLLIPGRSARSSPAFVRIRPNDATIATHVQRKKKPRFDQPNLGFGVGLRTVHFGHVLEKSEGGLVRDRVRELHGHGRTSDVGPRSGGRALSDRDAWRSRCRSAASIRSTVIT